MPKDCRAIEDKNHRLKAVLRVVNTAVSTMIPVTDDNMPETSGFWMPRSQADNVAEALIAFAQDREVMTERDQIIASMIAELREMEDYHATWMNWYNTRKRGQTPYDNGYAEGIIALYGKFRAGIDRFMGKKPSDAKVDA